MPLDAEQIEQAVETVEHDDHSFKRIFKQPKAAWAVAFACVVAFMGLGLVDPILPAIGKQLHATPAQVNLLFTSYMLVTGVMMLITGWLSSRIGPKRTLLLGLIIIVIFSALGGFSSTVGQLVGYRAGWGLGNALFISTALAVIVSVASGGTASAIILYEAALGLGMSVGPLLGGWLGAISWRGPFFGVAILMAIGFIGILVLLSDVEKPKQKSSILDPIKALGHRGLLSMGIMALLYNFGFFTLLAYSPYVLGLDEHGIGYVFFFWGVCLAITSIFVAPKLEVRFGTKKSMYVVLFLIALTLAVMGLGVHSQALLIACIIIIGAFLGINNTLVTTAVMEVSPVERSVASSAYSFVRFAGGSVAPWLAGKLAEWYNPETPFYVGAVAVILGMIVLFSGRHHMKEIS
ncbi:putative MFS family arabinose efflux permease [Scopulibacillus darangshiensis]|uniref:Putative MFS family arabinose efflux permease n=1 Tax=Scopulibacillus darangshiensis TaxID=442528 RepID=A0A4R2P972_9BACL|nr:MFS transporter [Scopulibacillus darangshiensis]TCP30611.1 putative MFS family arabinose efflux permease [Scopulibacillus darangshiensis]